jgi:ketol-acid reductoisomerase
VSPGRQCSVGRSSQEDQGVINDILGGHAMRFMDKNKIRRIQASVEGIRIKKVQNRSKMEKILAKLQKAIFRNEMKINSQEQKVSLATSGYRGKRSEKTQVQSNMHDVMESRPASEQDDEVVFGGDQELYQNQYYSITSGKR